VDQEVLVTAGRLIMKELQDEGAPPRAVLWVHATDTDTWKLWIIPHKSLSDKREFYRRLATIVAKHRTQLGGVDAADVEIITEQHPAIRGMRRAFKVTGQGVATVRNSLFDGYYLAEAIIMRMDL